LLERKENKDNGGKRKEEKKNDNAAKNHRLHSLPVAPSRSAFNF
jgi:hypothetical protein